MSVLLNGSMGFAMIIAILFCLGDLDAALSTDTGYPFIEIFLQATRSVKGTAAMVSVVTILSTCATVGGLASTSRMLWSFARDHGVPGWRIISRVSALKLHQAVNRLTLLFSLSRSIVVLQSHSGPLLSLVSSHAYSH